MLEVQFIVFFHFHLKNKTKQLLEIYYQPISQKDIFSIQEMFQVKPERVYLEQVVPNLITILCFMKNP